MATLAQCGMNITFFFVLVFLPFYVQQISHLDAHATLLWTGLIMGATSMAGAIFSPIWGALTARISPKLIFLRGIGAHALLVFLTPFLPNIYILFLIRVLEGAMGGVSTLGLIITSAASPRERLTQNLSVFQSGMTIGQLLGPPLGAATAALVGFKPAFLVSAGMTALVVLYTARYLSPIPPQKRSPGAEPRRSLPTLLAAAPLYFAVTLQLIFLPAILPRILAGMGVESGAAIVLAGLIVTAYTLASASTTYAMSRMGPPRRPGRWILTAGLLASGLQLLLALAGTPLLFTLVRVAQVACLSSVAPLLISHVAARGEVASLGFLNAGRFIGNALGPVLATFVLASASPLALYGLLSAILVVALLPQITRSGPGARGE
ncbi:MAG: MFS transporter [Deltaproteobacteria bacterium]|nr:MFS transporter [Deltaproteobacteria bacterium]